MKIQKSWSILLLFSRTFPKNLFHNLFSKENNNKIPRLSKNLTAKQWYNRTALCGENSLPGNGKKIWRTTLFLFFCFCAILNMFSLELRIYQNANRPTCIAKTLSQLNLAHTRSQLEPSTH